METVAVLTRLVPGERWSLACSVGRSETGSCVMAPVGEAAGEPPPWIERGGHVSEARVAVQVAPFHRQWLLAAGLARHGLPQWLPVLLGNPPRPAHCWGRSQQAQVRGRQAETALQ